jgi:hypothetical protein
VNNVDENGSEKMYCSEMVSKLFLGFLKIIGLYIDKFTNNIIFYIENNKEWLTFKEIFLNK